MKAARLVLALLAVGFAAFLAFRMFRGRDVAPALPQPTAPVTGTAIPPWLPQPGPRRANGDSTSQPLDFGADEAPPGTPVKPGADVSLVMPYRPGTKSRYRVAEADGQTDVASGDAKWGRFIWTVSTEVERVEDSGEARMRFQVESFVLQTSAPGHGRIEFDSASPDNSTLEDPALGLERTIRPLMAITGVPVQFVIDSAGMIRAVEGADALNRKFLDAADALGAQIRAAAEPNAPTAESWRQKWTEVFFPPTGAGVLNAAQSRDVEFQATFLDRWAVATPGRLRVTHDDPDVFRVEFKGKPDIRELNRPATSAAARSVEKAYVQSSADSYVASWRFDRAKGRLVSSRLHAKYVLVVSVRVGPGNNPEDFNARYTEIERELIVELLDK